MRDLIQVDVTIEAPFVESVNADDVERQVVRTVTAVAPGDPVALTIVITDDATIQRLNYEYLGVDGPTDVLAFSQSEGAALPAPDAGPRYLGDVVVSYERAVAQADAYDEPVERELDRLIIHGTLHLLGYDDQQEGNRKEMWDIQERILLHQQRRGKNGL